VSLATLALTQSTMDEGDAMIAHSGGALGLLLGGATELLGKGKTPADATPYRRLGYGTAIGVVAAGGGGRGAAAAIPLIFQNLTESATRGWLSATIGGSLAGGVLAWYLTRDAVPSKKSWLPSLPVPGILGTSASPTGAKPIYGLSWGGAL